MGNLDSSVGTVKGRTTDGCGSILAGFKTFSRFVNVQTVSGAHRILRSVVIYGFFLRVKAVEACSWPTAPLPVPGVRVRGATFPQTYTSPWRGLNSTQG
jgi:hypothetical protein